MNWPIAIVLCLCLGSCRVTLAEPAFGNACDINAPMPASCSGTIVAVKTTLSANTDLTNEECAALCGHLYCQQRVPFQPRCSGLFVSATHKEVWCAGTCLQ